MEIIPWKTLQHPLIPTLVTPLQQNQWCWIFGRSFYTFWAKIDLILTQIQRWIWEKQLIKLKVQRLHYDYLLHTTPFHVSFFHNLSMNTSHTQELTTFLHFILLFLLLFHVHTMSSPLVSLHDLPWACSPCPMKALKSFCTNQWPPHPSRANENLRMNGHPIEIRMRILGPNETQETFHPPIKEDDNPHD